jgi:DNA segregation ATPase FtsK/SpoIIIE-like protein
MSQTVWTGIGEGGSAASPARGPANGASNGHATDGGSGSGAGVRVAVGAGRAAVATAEGEEPTALESLRKIDWVLPSIELLEARGPGRVAAMDHEANKRRIEEKLLSFAIPARVVAVNSGPVVTQYEVKPEHHVKVSRIEALADDLAMALSARSIRLTLT